MKEFDEENGKKKIWRKILASEAHKYFSKNMDVKEKTCPSKN